MTWGIDHMTKFFDAFLGTDNLSQYLFSWFLTFGSFDATLTRASPWDW